MYSKSFRILWIILLITTGSEQLFSQHGTLLTLDAAINIALEKSYNTKVLKLQLIAAEQNLMAAKGRFRTQVDMDFSIPNWRESVDLIRLANELPVYNTTGQLDFSGTLNITQPLPTDGRITLQSQASHRDVSTYLASDDDYLKRKDVLTSVTLSLQQPIFAINELQLNLKEANLNYNLAQSRNTQRELELIYDVTSSFFVLFQATRQLQIAEDNLTQQESLFDLTSKKYDAGLIPEVDALTMEVDLAETRNQLLSVKARLGRYADEFKQLIGIELREKVGVKPTFEIDKYQVDLNEAIEHALNNRIEIQENQLNVEMAEINLKQVDARKQISGNLWAFYDLTGVSDPLLDYNSAPRVLFESSFDDMSHRPKNRGLGFTLEIPIWDSGVNRAEVQSAQARLDTRGLDLLEIQKTIEREVREVVSRLTEAENRLDVLKKREEVAERAFEITLHRFNNGDITSQELALNRDRLTEAKTSYLDAYITYKLADADLKRKTLWDFENQRSLVAD